MRALVTGVAGFIGSTLADQLVVDGWTVRGVDLSALDRGGPAHHPNLARLAGHAAVDLVWADLATVDLEPLLAEVEVVFHLAGQPGVRQSWADGFSVYADRNITVTQRLLEAAKDRPVKRFVYSSSSSVYGNADVIPTPETHPTRPHSPYGVTKLAGELLCSAYGANFGVPTTCLRYFTVYGPRQRPDMAIHRMISATLDGRPFPLFGDGSQVRDFTYVDDIVRATILAGTTVLEPATVLNAAGGGSLSMTDLIELVGQTVGRPVEIDSRRAQVGDVRETGGDVSSAGRLLGWSPVVDVVEGVRRQVAWHRAQR